MGDEVKGIVILNARAFAIERYGDEGWTRVIERLDQPDRDVLASIIPMGWYDILVYDRVNRAFFEVLGGEDLAVLEELGRYSAEHDLTTIHRIFLRVANPAYVLEKSAEFWRRYQTSGAWEITRVSPNRVHAVLRDWGSRDELTCIRLAAYMRRLFELVGAKNGWLERTKCRARGDEACVFEGGWD